MANPLLSSTLRRLQQDATRGEITNETVAFASKAFRNVEAIDQLVTFVEGKNPPNQNGANVSAFQFEIHQLKIKARNLQNEKDHLQSVFSALKYENEDLLLTIKKLTAKVEYLEHIKQPITAGWSTKDNVEPKAPKHQRWTTSDRETKEKRRRTPSSIEISDDELEDLINSK